MKNPDKLLDTIIPATESVGKPCSFCKGGHTATGVLAVDFRERVYLWPICQECHGWASDPDSGWVPVCCTECGGAGWVRREEGHVKVDESASMVFTQGCPTCSPEGSKHIWCL